MKYIARIPRLTWILGITVIVLLIIFILQQTMQPRENVITVNEITDDITRIVITDANSELIIDQVENEWQVSGFPASQDSIDSLIDSINAVGGASVVSNRRNYKQYGLTQEKYFTFYTDDKILLLLEIGENASAGEAVYGRVNEMSQVVLLPRVLQSSMNTDVVFYREKSMLVLPEEDIQAMRITGGDADIQIMRAVLSDDADVSTSEIDRLERDWDIVSSVEIEGRLLQGLFLELENFEAADFPSNHHLQESFAILEVEKKTSEKIRIELFPPNESSQYGIRISTSPYEFFIPDWRARRLLLGVDQYFAAFTEGSQ